MSYVGRIMRIETPWRGSSQPTETGLLSPELGEHLYYNGFQLASSSWPPALKAHISGDVATGA
jgi:hypothetical protein